MAATQKNFFSFQHENIFQTHSVIDFKDVKVS